MPGGVGGEGPGSPVLPYPDYRRPSAEDHTLGRCADAPAGAPKPPQSAFFKVRRQHHRSLLATPALRLPPRRESLVRYET